MTINIGFWFGFCFWFFFLLSYSLAPHTRAEQGAPLPEPFCGCCRPGHRGDPGTRDRGTGAPRDPPPRSRRAAAAPCPSPPRLVAFALATSGGGGGGDGSSLFPPGPRFTGRSPRSEGLLARSWASTLGCAVRAGARSGICRSCSPLALPYAAPVLQILAESPSIRGARIKDEEARGGERGMCVMP